MTLKNGGYAACQVNPSLAVDAVFIVSLDGDQQRTRLALRNHPGLAAWLLSILDFILQIQGKLPGEHRIAEPPAGPTRQLLIDGRVLFAESRSDGGQGLRLNPEFQLQLLLYARRRGARAHTALLPLAQDPDLSRWLLTHYARAGDGAQPVTGGALAEGLRQHAVLVEEPPADEAWFPDPDAPTDPAAELATAARLFTQCAGEPLPPEVRKVLGRHTPALPPEVDLVWSEDAGTGMVYPNRQTSRARQPDLAGVGGAEAARRAVFWERQREAARASLRTRQYATLRDIVPAAQREKLRRYVRQLVDRGYFPALGDGQVELRAALHNQPTIAAIHQGLAGIVNSISAEPVIASYCYLSCYEEGAVLARHKDRKQCVYNLSLVLDMQNAHGAPEPWPIYLELDGRAEAVLLEVGDGLCYSGTDIWHWRDALPKGQRAIVCFYHFVPAGYAGSLD